MLIAGAPLSDERLTVLKALGVLLGFGGVVAMVGLEAFGALVLGERLAPTHFVGMALIAAGLAAIDGRLFKRR